MYTVTTDTGLSSEHDTERQAWDALRDELTAHAARQSINWSITVGPPQSLRWIGGLDYRPAAPDQLTQAIAAYVHDLAPDNATRPQFD